MASLSRSLGYSSFGQFHVAIQSDLLFAGITIAKIRIFRIAVLNKFHIRKAHMLWHQRDFIS